MNAEGFAPWCAEAKQICRQSYFADGFAVETSSFRGTFCKLDEPGCPVSHNYMGRTEVIPKASEQGEKYLICTEKEVLWQTLLLQSLQTSSSRSEKLHCVVFFF